MKKKFLLLVLTICCVLLLWILPRFFRTTSAGQNLRVTITRSRNTLPIIKPEDPFTKNIRELSSIVENRNPRVALEELQHRMDTDPYVFKNCHEMAHEIGHEAIKKYKNFTEALSYQDITCADGYLHGIIEEMLGNTKGDTAALLTTLGRLCDRLGKNAERCYHGVGHGMMFYTKNDLPRALKLCQKNVVRGRGRCYEGVFMENFISDPDLHPSQYVDPRQPMSPCTHTAPRYKGYCYFYVPYYLLRLHDDDFKTVLRSCETAEHGYVAACVRGVGSIAMKFNINNPKYVESICDSAPPTTEPLCISGMTSYYFVFSFRAAKVKDMCNTLEPKDRLICLQTMRWGKSKYFVD